MKVKKLAQASEWGEIPRPAFLDRFGGVETGIGGLLNMIMQAKASLECPS